MTEMQHSAAEPDAFPADSDQLEIDAAETLALSCVEDPPFPGELDTPLLTCHPGSGLERSLLADCMLDAKQVRHIREVASLFGTPNRDIARVVLDLDADGITPDTTTVTDRLRENGKLAGVGGPLYIMGLLDGVPKSGNARSQAKALRRVHRIQNAAANLYGAGDALRGGDTPARVAELIEGALDDISAAATEDEPLSALGRELATCEIRELKGIVRGLIDEGNRGFVFGDGGVAKSFTLLGILAHVAGGLTIAETWRVPEPLSVAFLFLEDRKTPDGGWHPRILWRFQSILLGIREQLREQGYTDNEIERSIEMIGANLFFWCGTDIDAGLAAARDHGSRLTVIDSWNVICPDDETDTKGRNEIRRIVDRIHGALGNESFLIVDHTRKGTGDRDTKDKDRQYGSVGKHNGSEVQLMFADAEVDGDVAVVLKSTKGRDGAEVPTGGKLLRWVGLTKGCKFPLNKPIPLRLAYVRDNADPQDLGNRSVEQKEDRWGRAETFVRAVGGSRSVADLAELLEVQRRTVERWVRDKDSPFEMIEPGIVGLK